MVELRIAPDSAPRAPHAVHRQLMALFARSAAMGVLSGPPVTGFDAATLRRLVMALQQHHLLGSAPLDLAPPLQDGALDARATPHVEQALDRAVQALEDSPAPAAEWPALRQVFGDSLLAQPIHTSASSLRRYAGGERETPQPAAERLHWLAMVVADLAGAYNDFGNRRWFDRARSQLDGRGPRQLLKELRLVGGYELLYPKVKSFLREQLFEASPVELQDPVVLRNLSEPEAGKLLFDHFKAGINALTVRDSGAAHVEGHIRLLDARPFRTQPRGYVVTQKSVFNRMVGEAGADGLELDFAAFLEAAPDVQAHAKNYLAVGFRIDYVRANGELSTYTPDFIVRDTAGGVRIVETKGREELDLPQKMARLKQWCADASAASQADGGPRYGFVFVDQQGFDQHKPQNFAGLLSTFREYQ